MKQPVIFRVAAGLLALLSAGGVAAAVDCRMPNGVTITLQTATQCPPDAAQLDGSGKVVRPPRQAPRPAPKTAAPVVVAPPAPKPPVGPSAFDVVSAACDALRNTRDVSECVVHSNIFSPNTMDITTNVAPRLAWADCVTLAAQLRKASPAGFLANPWQLRYFSPFSGNRPIATCEI